MKKKLFEDPELEILHFGADVIVSSTDDTGGYQEGGGDCGETDVE